MKSFKVFLSEKRRYPPWLYAIASEVGEELLDMIIGPEDQSLNADNEVFLATQNRPPWYNSHPNNGWDNPPPGWRSNNNNRADPIFYQKSNWKFIKRPSKGYSWDPNKEVWREIVGPPVPEELDTYQVPPAEYPYATPGEQMNPNFVRPE